MPSEYETVNAIIESASVQIDRGFMLTAWLMLDYGGSGQGFGGFVLGGTPDSNCGDHRRSPNYAAEFIIGCLRAADVESFDAMKGKTIRVRRRPGFDGTINAIGHIVKNDRWFAPAVTFSKWKEADDAD